MVPSPFLAFTPTDRHAVYPAISPSADLAGSAQGLKVLVTGAGRGIGRTQAITFARAGAEKIVLNSRNITQLEEVEAAIKEAVGEGRVEVIKAVGDVSQLKDVESIFDAAGEIDVLISNAGAWEPLLAIHESDPEEWWRVQEVNVKGTYLITRELLRRFLGRPLTILCTTSITSTLTSPGAASYQTSKSHINRFCEFVHFEYQSKGVRVFTYHPGYVQTDLTRATLPKAWEAYLVDPPELAAGLTLWLATQVEKTEFLRGRYVSANWDVDEILERKEDIISKGLFWTRIVGQEPPVELIPWKWE